MLRRPAIFGLLALSLIFLSTMYAQTPGVTTRYVYDANGRLRAVITPEGAAIYEYDPAGNFTRIRRLGPGDCEALEFTPRQGPPGTAVTLFGISLAQATAVTFNGKAAEIVSKTTTAIEVKVPDGAESGPIVVTLPCGAKTFSAPFTVSGIRVTPATIAVLPNRTVQYTAVVAGVIDPSVIWSVSEVVGGNETAGTISENGLYTAPAQAPNTSSTHLIRATSVVEPSIFGEAQARVTGSGFEVLAQGVSVRYGTPPNLVVAYIATPVAVRYGPPDPKGQAFLATPVAVRYGEASREGKVYVTSPVSVMRGERSGSASLMLPASGSATRNPVITKISSEFIVKGAITDLTISGQNLSTVTGISFIREDGSSETEFSISNLRCSDDGSSLKIRLSVSRKAVSGRRIIQITTPSGTSQSRANLIEVLP